MWIVKYVCMQHGVKVASKSMCDESVMSRIRFETKRCSHASSTARLVRELQRCYDLVYWESAQRPLDHAHSRANPPSAALVRAAAVA